MLKKFSKDWLVRRRRGEGEKKGEEKGKEKGGGRGEGGGEGGGEEKEEEEEEEVEGEEEEGFQHKTEWNMHRKIWNCIGTLFVVRPTG